MAEWLRDLRRDFHRHPELRFEEARTAARVAEYLSSFGLEVKTGIGRTGVVGLLRGAKPGRTFAIRSDMDALPIQEETGAEYASVNPGVMHACGHDSHMAMLLGTARVLAESPDLRSKINGQVKFIFQPGEEGGHGAREMIADGVLENPSVDTIVAAHVAPLINFGEVGIYLREACASADAFEIRIAGKGAHAAYPHLSRDPVFAGAQLITAIQSIVSRNTAPAQGLVVSVTRVSAGTATNVIPDEMFLAGTIRALRQEVRDLAISRLKEIVEGTCRSHGLDGKVSLGDGYPPMINHEPVSRFVAGVATEMLGKNKVLFRQPKFGSEDFAYFLERCPGAGFDLGCANEAKGFTQMLHTSRFDLDEEVMPIGVELYLRLVEKYFEKTI
ncbi:MAG: M20 family metallopeptidase [Syntrophobacteria bacterium]